MAENKDKIKLEENFVGFFNLLLTIDRRLNPKDYDLGKLDKSGHRVYSKNKQ